MTPSESLRLVTRDRARRNPVSRLEQLRSVRALSEVRTASAVQADVPGTKGPGTSPPMPAAPQRIQVDDAARPRRAAMALVVAVTTAAALGAIIGVSGSSALHEALRIMGLAGESAVETVQRKQAAAISELDRTVQALNAAVAGVSAHTDFAGRREDATTRRIDQIDDGLGALRKSLDEMRAAQAAAAAEEPWRKPVAQLAAAVTKAHGELAGLRASLDDAGPARRPDLAAIGERIDRLEQAMVQHNLLGSIRGSIQDTRQRPPVSRESPSTAATPATPATNGHIINLTPAAE
jgi:hypothetical protein